MQFMSSISSENIKNGTKTLAMIMAVSEASKILFHNWILRAQQLWLLSVGEHMVNMNGLIKLMIKCCTPLSYNM